jgi:hypothetical protein
MIEILEYKPMDKGALKGYVNIYMPKNGLELYGCALFEKDDKAWVGLPQKEYTDKDGQKKYMSIIRWRERSHQDAFNRAVIEAVRLHQPKKQPPKQESLFDEEVPF